jgi:hypothetical protein
LSSQIDPILSSPPEVHFNEGYHKEKTENAKLTGSKTTIIPESVELEFGGREGKSSCATKKLKQVAAAIAKPQIALKL